MSWLREQARRANNPRTYALLAVLGATLIGVWLTGPRADVAPVQQRAPAGAPPAVQAAGRAAEPWATPTPPGWGSDPFRAGFGGEPSGV